MSKKRILTYSCLFLFLILAGSALFLHHSGISFPSYTNMMFQKEVSNDTLSLHYTLADPSKYGIKKARQNLPLFNPDCEKERLVQIENYLCGLKHFDEASLNKEDAYTLTLLSDNLNHELLGSRYFYLRELLSPSNGTQTQYPILMAEYSLRSKKDIEEYLSILSDTPAYFESIIAFEKEKAVRGYFMSDASLLKIKEQCDSIFVKESIESGTCFLQLTFKEHLQKAAKEDIITCAEQALYEQKHTAILLKDVYPAYQKLGTSLLNLASIGKNEGGLSNFEQGRDYYRWLFYETTGSDTELDTVYQTLATDYYNHLYALQQKLKNFPAKELLTMEAAFPLTDSTKMLAHIQSCMAKDFPAISSFCNEKVSAPKIKAVSSAMENYTAPAYYLLPPIDETDNNIIYVNEKEVPSGFQLYTTLAHEGYPGHMYQTNFFQLYQKEMNIPKIRAVLNYGGYVEGWALYTELYSYSYAAKLYKTEKEQQTYSALYSMYKDERCMQLGLLSLLDIGIHYYGFSFERVAEILKYAGVENEEQQLKIYEYILEEPTVYPKYYWGYLEIENLKAKAKKLYGTSYTDYRFHEFFLQAGPSDFKNLEKRLYSFSSSILSK